MSLCGCHVGSKNFQSLQRNYSDLKDLEKRFCYFQ